MVAGQPKQMGMTNEDVSPLDSEDDSDLDNDPVVRTARDSTEVANHDREILDEEEEREKLLASNGKAKLSDGFFGRRRNVGLPHANAGRQRVEKGLWGHKG